MPVTQLPRTLTALVLVGSILALTACTGPDPSPPTSSSPPPVFANEEEALTAVTATYQQFLDTANLILHEGGSAPERISAIMAPEVAEVELEAYGRMHDNGYDQSATSRSPMFNCASSTATLMLLASLRGRSLVR
jgi:hypothetical protein